MLEIRNKHADGVIYNSSS